MKTVRVYAVRLYEAGGGHVGFGLSVRQALNEAERFAGWKLKRKTKLDVLLLPEGTTSFGMTDTGAIVWERGGEDNPREEVSLSLKRFSPLVFVDPDGVEHK